MLDELKEQAALQAPVAVAGDIERDRQREMRVLAALRGNYLGRSGRYRQGVVFPRAMYAEEAREMAAHLRRGVMLGESLALLACLGGIVGLTVSVAPDIAFGEARREGGPAFRLDLDDGCAGYDLDRVLEHAEKSKGQSCQPASRVVLVRLPGFLVDEIRRRRARLRSATHLCDLTGRPEWEGRARATPGAGYRLKPTFTRFRRSLGPALLDDGVAPIVAAAALLDFRLGTKSNHAYVVYMQSMVDDALDRLYRILGWN
jgi:hypothetical protein